MKQNNKINSFSLSALILPLSGAPFWGILTSYMVHTSKTATLISMIIGFIISLIISKIFLKFFDCFPDLLGADKIKRTFGFLSYLINSLYGIIALIMYIFLSYRLSNFISSQYLTETLNTYIYALIIFITTFIASKKIETITRISIISFYISLIIFVFDFSSLITNIDYNNFLPLVTVSLKDILKSSISFSLYFTLPLFYLLCYKKNNLVDKDKFNKMYYKMLTLSFMILFISLSTTIGVYGIYLTNLFDYPLYTVLKKIKIFSFLESIENISVIIWIIYTINACSLLLCSTFDNLKITYNLNNKKSNILNIILIILIFIFPLLFYNNSNFVETYEYVKIPLLVTFILLVLVILTTFIISLKYKKRKIKSLSS